MYNYYLLLNNDGSKIYYDNFIIDYFTKLTTKLI